MTALETFLEILKYTLPALVVMLTAFLIIRTYLVKKYETEHLQLRLTNQQELLPLRIKAFERLALYLERITPDNLVTRERKPNMTAAELQHALISTIRSEFEHNLSQQIYISRQTWLMVKAAKEETIGFINRMAVALPPNASGNDLGRAIFTQMMSDGQAQTTQKALQFVHEEVRFLYE